MSADFCIGQWSLIGAQCIEVQRTLNWKLSRRMKKQDGAMKLGFRNSMPKLEMQTQVKIQAHLSPMKRIKVFGVCAIYVGKPMIHRITVTMITCAEQYE